MSEEIETYGNNLEITVIDPVLALRAVLAGFIPISCVEFKGLKEWAKAEELKPGQGMGWGLLILAGKP